MVSSLVLAVVVAAQGVSIMVGPVEMVNGGYKFTEGPLWTPQGLLFSDLRGDTIHRGDGTVFRHPSGKANGLGLDQAGRLIACEHNNRRLSATEPGGNIVTLADNFEGKKFNSPNDLDFRSDGTIYFTDPPYGLGDKPSDLGYNGVFMLSPAGKVTLLHKEMNRPNGIALSKDEKILYVADSEDNLILAFDVAPDGTASNARKFADCPGPDGIEIGPQGELWAAAKDGVRVYLTEGAGAGMALLTVPCPEQPANLTLGGEDGKTLYLTARTGLYKATVTWDAKPFQPTK
jgi:sugar lactone lactonase YvrE